MNTIKWIYLKREVYSQYMIKTNDYNSEKSEKMNQYDKDQKYKYIMI